MKSQTYRRIASVFAGILSASLLLTGCGKSKDIVLYGSAEEFGSATLCDYSNLSLTKNVYTVTDDMVNEQVDSLVEENVSFDNVDRPIEKDDLVSAMLTISCDGEVLYDFTDEEEGGYEMTVGYEEFGPEVDEKLIGAKKGDHLSFSIKYDDDYELEDFAGKEVSYDFMINSVSVENVPEMNDDFIKNTLGYDSKDALMEATKKDLEAQYEETSDSELRTEILANIIDNSTFEEYSAETISEYKLSVEQSYASYMEMFGASTIDEIYTMFEVTPEDIESEAINMARQATVINQIGREQNMTITKAEFDELANQYATDYEYDSAKELLADYGEDTIKSWMLEDRVYAYIIEHATITENKVSATDFEGMSLGEDDEELLEEEGMEEGMLLDDEDELDEDSDEDALTDFDEADFDDEDAFDEEETDDDEEYLDDEDFEDDSFDDEDFSDDSEEDYVDDSEEDTDLSVETEE